MFYFVETVQRNRIVKLVMQSRYYDKAESAFQQAKRSMCREARFLKHDDKRGRILLKYAVKGNHSKYQPQREA